MGSRRILYTPEQFRKIQKGPRLTAEGKLQINCVDWFRAAYPSLKKLLICNLNGAELLHGAAGWELQEAQGAVKGAADLMLQVPSGDYGYLAIEMKTSRGRQRPDQFAFEKAVMANGGAYAMPRSLNEFKRVVTSYLERGEY